MAVPSYKEFRKAVYKSYKKSLKVQDQDEVEEYFKSDEAEEVMKNEYKNLKKKLENGDISENVILGGGAGGCAQCLVMMF